MSKLAQIQEALKRNPNVVIVSRRDESRAPNKDQHVYAYHIVEIFVAPTEGGLYTVEALRAFMRSLIPEALCYHYHEEEPYEQDDVLVFGALQFEEAIGTETGRRVITITDPDTFSSKGFVDGQRVVEYTQSVQRQIRVRLFPDVAIATGAIHHVHEWQIPKAKLPQTATDDERSSPKVDLSRSE